MLLFKRVQDIENHLVRVKKEGLLIGFVPTMGALHSGHISLIKSAQKTCNVVVCSIFVNPTQFNDKADFEKYPVTIDRDIELLSEAGCDILLLPSVSEIYPNGVANKQKIDFGFLAETLEGEHRPGHFDGMAQVVERLLRIVKPNKLYMGQKDYQQQLIVAELIRKRKLKTQLVVGETIREGDGLAMSSRNVRLDKASRETALLLSKALRQVKAKLKLNKAEVRLVSEWGRRIIISNPDVTLEYFEIRDSKTLRPILRKQRNMVALVAARIGGVRLIDNMLL
jgi:pantoate--beta-alanine ligase